jgi:hypothetical protein
MAMPVPRGVELRLDPVEVSRKQVRACHTKLDQCAAAAMHRSQPPTGSPYPARLYMHALVVEDITVQTVLLDVAPLFTSLYTGVGGPNANRAALNQYARAVYAATDAFLAQLPEDGLDRIVDLHCLGLGRRTVAWVIQRFVVAELKRISSAISGATATTGSHGTPSQLHPPRRRRSPRSVNRS